MPYNPSVNNNAGAYLAGGINQAAQAIASGIDQHQLTSMDLANMGGKAQAYAQQGVLSPDDLTQFLNGNIAKKREIVGKADAVNALVAQQFMRNQSQQQLGLEAQKVQNESDFQNASLGLQQASLDRLHPENFLPSDSQPLKDSDGNVFGFRTQIAPGQYQITPNTPKIQPIDPSQGPITKQVGSTLFYFDHQNGGWKPVAPPNFMNSMMNGAGGGGPGVSINLPAGGGAPSQPAGMGVSGAPGAPVGGTAPAAPAAASGVSGGPSNALSPGDQQAYAWAVANPTDPRSQKILSKLGVQ